MGRGAVRQAVFRFVVGLDGERDQREGEQSGKRQGRAMNGSCHGDGSAAKDRRSCDRCVSFLRRKQRRRPKAASGTARYRIESKGGFDLESPRFQQRLRDVF
jgi:hypothetical protein